MNKPRKWRPVWGFDSHDKLIQQNQRITLPNKKEQPFLARIQFKPDSANKYISQDHVAIRDLKQNPDKTLSFKITDIYKTVEYKNVPLKNIDFLIVLKNSKEFKQRFRIYKCLRDKK